MDNELFELCKEVWKELNWQIEDCKWILSDENGEYFIDSVTAFIPEFTTIAPLYTSDYLVEKLHNREIRLQKVQASKLWFIEDVNFPELNQIDEVPLKALLKLTLALAKAGELK